MAKVKITIDNLECGDPRDCRICVGACPPGVFNLIFVDKNIHDPKDWRIVPVFPQICERDCVICVEKCPKKAIIVKKR